MQRVRLTISHNSDDPADDLRYAARVRRDLWAHSPVEIDPDSSVHPTRRDADCNAYFEFTTQYLPEIERVLTECGHRNRVQMNIVQEDAGPECINCGKTAGPVLPTVCPNCGFRDVSPCPHCGNEVPRQEYQRLGGDLFRCSTCGGYVRLRLRDPLFVENGRDSQSVVIVEPARNQQS
jgi:hypothetical protein